MKEILINSDFQETRVAFLTDNKLDDFFVERERINGHIQAGNIYKGIVESIITGMDAAFINIGTEKRGFLCVADIVAPAMEYDDLNAPANSRDNKSHREKQEIGKLLKVGQEILVQVVKEPISTKGPRLTTHIAVPGRYVVLMPIERHIGISKRIRDFKERDRIREILKELPISEEMGIIVRTAAINKSKKEFIREVKYLVHFWKNIVEVNKKSKAPCLIHREQALEIRIVRDFLYDDVDKVIVDSKDLYKKIMGYIRLLMPGMIKKIECYDAQVPLFEARDIEKEIEKIYNKYVYLKSGGHLIIEQMESLVAIDVNTGKFTGKKNLEDTVLKVNLEAAEEIARQVRLKDLGGIIIVDFIDMYNRDQRRKVLQTLHDNMLKDKSKFDILGMSELCLVEMTRQRVRRSVEGSSHQTCSYCKGRGTVKSSWTMAIWTLRKVKSYIKKTHQKNIEISLHPDVASRLFNEDRLLLTDLEKQTGVKIAIRPEINFAVEDIVIN